MFQIFAALADFERARICQRTDAGLTTAHGEAGAPGNSRRSCPLDQVRTARPMHQQTNMSVATYRSPDPPTHKSCGSPVGP